MSCKSLLQLVKIDNGIMRQALIARKRTEWHKEPSAEWKKEQTAIALVQSGLPEEWWDCAMECCCYLHVHDWMADGKTAFEMRCGQTCDGPSIPFGTLVEYIPTTAKDMWRAHQFGKKALKRIFLGYVLRAGEGWSGDLMIADNEDLQGWQASDIYVKRDKSQGVYLKGESEFPCFLVVQDRHWQSRETSRKKMMLEPKRATKKEAKQHIRGPRAENFSCRHHDERLLKLYDPGLWNLPDPIEKRRRNETNSDEN